MINYMTQICAIWCAIIYLYSKVKNLNLFKHATNFLPAYPDRFINRLQER